MSAYNFEELRRHIGHKVKVVEYSRDGYVYNVAVECATCNEVLLDYDNPEEEGVYVVPERCPRCDSALDTTSDQVLPEKEMRRFELACTHCSWSSVFEILLEKWVKATFTIDDQNTIEGYHLPGQHWNGWATPLFEKEVLIRWLKEQILGNDKIAYVEQLDAVYCPEDGGDPGFQWAVGKNILTEDGWKHLYGPEGWCWDRAEGGDDICFCGHTREAHLPERGRCGLSGCDCRGFTDPDE